MTWKLVVVAVLCVVTAFAIVPQTTNTRPVTIGSPAGSEASLQTILNSVFGCSDCVDAVTDQSSAAMWQEPGANATTVPVLQATYAADSDIVGLYTNFGTLVPIFTGSAVTGDKATISFNTNGTITIAATVGGSQINAGTWSGINQYDFGFYLQDGNNIYYTSDNGNAVSTPVGNSPNKFSAGYSTKARAVAYDDTALDRWAIAFEDGTDFDYNDRVITIESIEPAVPEPAAIALFGTVLALCASRLRRRSAS